MLNYFRTCSSRLENITWFVKRVNIWFDLFYFHSICTSVIHSLTGQRMVLPGSYWHFQNAVTFSHKLITHHTLMSFDILTVLSINKPISPSQFLIKLLNTIIVHHSLLIHTRHSKPSGYSYQYNVWTTTYRGVTMSTHLIHRSYVTCFALSKFQLIIIVL